MKCENPIDRLIEAKRAKIDFAELALEKLRIEFAALEEARQAVAANPSKPAPQKKHANETGKGPRRGRSLSDGWKHVLVSIGGNGNTGASMDDILNFCQAEGITLKRPTLRAQLSNYVKREYVARKDTGVFTLLPNGAKVAGTNLNSGNKQVSAKAENKMGHLR